MNTADPLRGLSVERAWAHIRLARDLLLTDRRLAYDPGLVADLGQLNDGLRDLDQDLVTERVIAALRRAAQINADAELRACKDCTP